MLDAGRRCNKAERSTQTTNNGLYIIHTSVVTLSRESCYSCFHILFCSVQVLYFRRGASCSSTAAATMMATCAHPTTFPSPSVSAMFLAIIQDCLDAPSKTCLPPPCVIDVVGAWRRLLHSPHVYHGGEGAVEHELLGLAVQAVALLLPSRTRG